MWMSLTAAARAHTVACMVYVCAFNDKGRLAGLFLQRKPWFLATRVEDANALRETKDEYRLVA